MSNQDDHIDSPFDDEINRDPMKDGRASHDGHQSHSDHASHEGTRKPTAQAAGYAPAAPFRNAPRCASCGYDLSGLSDDSGCPECGGFERKGFGHEPQCTFCGYALTGLDVGSNCPECGKPIWDSNIQPPLSGMSIASMVCGISALVTCPFYGILSLVLGPLGIIFGEIAVRQFKRGERGGMTKGFALTGRICGWVAFVPAVILWGIIIVAIVMG